MPYWCPSGTAIHQNALGSTDSLCFALGRLLLEKFYIGDLATGAEAGPRIVSFHDDSREGEFYDVLKRRIENYFRSNEVRSCKE